METQRKIVFARVMSMFGKKEFKMYQSIFWVAHVAHLFMKFPSPNAKWLESVGKRRGKKCMIGHIYTKPINVERVLSTLLPINI